MKRIFLAVLLAAMSSISWAQPANFDINQVVYKYDLDSTSETFCSLSSAWIPVADRVAAASSATVTAVSGTPFADVSVGDMLMMTDSPTGGGESYTRAVVAKASSTSITVNNAISPDVNPTLTSGALKYKKLTCGTGVNNGAFGVPYRAFTVVIALDQIVATDYVEFKLYCRVGSSPWFQYSPAVTPPAISANGWRPTSVSYIPLSYSGAILSECRVGMKVNTADDGNDLTTNLEQVSVVVAGLK